MAWSTLISNRKLALEGLGALLLLMFSTVAPVSAGAGNPKHKITVTFNYDFSATPACSSIHDSKCVEEFVLYDISAGVAKRTELLAIPVPSQPHGFVKGISATTAPLLFESGKHFLALVARTPDGTESRAATVWVTIP
ncbi:MAG: hypothetical protein KGL75_01655 [Acidobacteriota bacterium]|nr:hypothetical protein [Acidobacteriota bacterium]